MRQTYTPNETGGGWHIERIYKGNFTVHPTILHTTSPTDSWMSFDAYSGTREHVKRSVISPDFCYCTVYTVKEIGGEPDRKPHPIPYGLKNPYGNLKSDNSQDYAQKPQRKCTFMTSAAGW
jgi:hypothetical protein